MNIRKSIFNSIYQFQWKILVKYFDKNVMYYDNGFKFYF